MSLKIPRTMVHQLHEVAERLKDEPALWTRRGPEWVPTSWRQYAQRVRDFALGLQSLGFEPKQALTVMGFNREEWVVAALGAMASGGVSVGRVHHRVARADRLRHRPLRGAHRPGGERGLPRHAALRARAAAPASSTSS